MMGRPPVTTAIVEAGVFEVAVAHLHKSSPHQWVDWRCAEGLQAAAIFSMAMFMVQSELPKKTELMIDSGMADAVSALVKAFELGGPSKTDDAIVGWGIDNAIWALTELDLSAPEARPIVQLLEGMPSALRFALDHPLDHFKAVGLSSGAFCAVSSPH